MSEIPRDDLTALERLTPEELPRLAIFLAGWLHQDLAVEHGSAARAAWEYASEAELDELEELGAEWNVLRAAAHEAPLDAVNDALRRRFGSDWRATSRDEIDAVARELELALRE